MGSHIKPFLYIALFDFNGQSFKYFTIVMYDSTVVVTRNLPRFIIYDCRAFIIWVTDVAGAK